MDNFLFCVLVPDYNTEKKKKIRRNNFIGSQNRKIRELLNANRLEICIVKGISFFGSKNSKRRNARQHARSEQ